MRITSNPHKHAPDLKIVAACCAGSDNWTTTSGRAKSSGYLQTKSMQHIVKCINFSTHSYVRPIATLISRYSMWLGVASWDLIRRAGKICRSDSAEATAAGSAGTFVMVCRSFSGWNARATLSVQNRWRRQAPMFQLFWFRFLLKPSGSTLTSLVRHQVAEMLWWCHVSGFSIFLTHYFTNFYSIHMICIIIYIWYVYILCHVMLYIRLYVRCFLYNT